jgi:hypothetical protein
MGCLVQELPSYHCWTLKVVFAGIRLPRFTNHTSAAQPHLIASVSVSYPACYLSISFHEQSSNSSNSFKWQNLDLHENSTKFPVAYNLVGGKLIGSEGWK